MPYDSLKFCVDFSCMKNTPPTTNYYNPAKRKEDTTRLKGVSYWHYDAARKEGLLTISSKLLQDPARLLSSETIEEALWKVNEAGILMLCPTRTLETARVIEPHATRDVITDNNPGEYIHAMYAGYVGLNYLPILENNGIYFQYMKARSGPNKVYSTLYDKHVESGRSSQVHPHTLRLESKYRSQAAIRKHVGQTAGPVTLQTLLDTDSDGVTDIFARIFQDVYVPPQGTYLKRPNSTRMRRKASDMPFLFMKTLKPKERSLFSFLLTSGFNLDTAFRLLLPGPGQKPRSRAEILAPYQSILALWRHFEAPEAPEYHLLREIQQKLSISLN